MTWTNVTFSAWRQSVSSSSVGRRTYEHQDRGKEATTPLFLQSMLVVAILTLCFTMPMPSAFAQGANSFTGSASAADSVIFTSTGSMSDRRNFHSATLLNNGKVLVAGGDGGCGFNCNLSSAELYDLTTGTWSVTGSMSDRRNFHSATLLNNGMVLVAGGDDGRSYHASTELYDPATGTWSPTGSMHNPRRQHKATLLNNGKVLVAGGEPEASPELYDPATGTWSVTGSMSGGRVLHTATLLSNGKVLVAGGFALASAELYDPVMGTWSATGSMNGDRKWHTATLLSNGKMLVAGGEGCGRYCYLASAELYDPAAGNWSVTGSMSGGRTSHTATLLNNSKVLIAGGLNYIGSSLYSLASAELYDPATGTWSASGSISVARYRHTATLLSNGKVLLAGGINYIGLYTLAIAELGTLTPGNNFSGTLTLPSGWLTTTAINVLFVGNTSAASISTGALSNDRNTWGSWVAATPGATTSTAWNVTGEGAKKPVGAALLDFRLNSDSARK